MQDQPDVEHLKDRLHALEAEQEALRETIVRLQLDQWQARIDDLEVQIHLGALDLGDRVEPTLDTLRNRWLDAVRRVDEAPGRAEQTLDAVRDGLDRALADVRDAFVTAVRTSKV